MLALANINKQLFYYFIFFWQLCYFFLLGEGRIVESKDKRGVGVVWGLRLQSLLQL